MAEVETKVADAAADATPAELTVDKLVVDEMVSKIQMRLDILEEQKKTALAEHRYLDMPALDQRTKALENRLAHVQSADQLAIKLKEAQEEQNWNQCQIIYRQITDLKNGHFGLRVTECCKTDCCHCCHGPHEVDGVHLTCCGQTDLEHGICRQVQVGDRVTGGKTDEGVVAYIEPEADSTLPYLLVQPNTGDTCWAKASDVSTKGPFALAGGHTGSYRVFHPARCVALYGPHAGTKLQGGCDETCTHEAKPEGGFTHSHYTCCNQTKLDSPCEQVQLPTLAPGAVVTVNGKIGVVVGVEPRDAQPYIVAIKAEDTRSFAVSEVDAVTPEVQAQVVEELTRAHKGEFRGETHILFSSDPDRVGKPLHHRCSLPDNKQEDGPACAHAAPGKTVEVMPRLHFSCCGNGVFSECEIDELSLGLMKLLGALLGRP